MTSADQPRDQLLIRRAINAALLSVRTVLPGTVTAYNHAEQTATVEVGVRVLDNDEDSPLAPRLVAIPPLEDVPVCQLAGGGFHVAFPLEAGDPVLVLFCEQDPSLWLESGAVSDPLDHSRHALHPVCIPGPRPSPVFLEGLPAGTLVVGKEGGLQMRINATKIELGNVGGTFDDVACASKVEAQLTAIKDALSNAIPLVQDGGAQFQTQVVAALSAFPGDVSSSKVRVES